MSNWICQMVVRIAALKDLPPLFFRILLAYGFYGPAMQKWSNLENVAQWFASLGYPLPTFNAYMAATTESVGVVLLTLGLGTRFISVPLMFVMIIAITTVHWSHGFEASKNGFEIPLYYFLMLFSLLVTGAGKYSLDRLICRCASKNEAR